ncbi:response regulator [Xanthobacter autotrophicus DSM 431]|uniref:response regulator n=1 Tax=Xanthobacter nonsaccharivorans TaxID=3119912 RepID=UPI003728DFF2
MGPVLIVDDEPEYLDELVEALSFRGIPAVSAGQGARAVALLADDPSIRVILTDLRMPDMDGISLIHAVRAAYPARRLDFLVMTGHAAEADIERAMAEGVLRCFPKPLAFDALYEALADLNARDAQS